MKGTRTKQGNAFLARARKALPIAPYIIKLSTRRRTHLRPNTFFKTQNSSSHDLKNKSFQATLSCGAAEGSVQRLARFTLPLGSDQILGESADGKIGSDQVLGESADGKIVYLWSDVVLKDQESRQPSSRISAVEKVEFGLLGVQAASCSCNLFSVVASCTCSLSL